MSVPIGNFPERQIVPIIDPSVVGLPDSVVGAYRSMNNGIADTRIMYGDTLQRNHLALSQRAISATAQTALLRAPAGEDRSAIVLGAGGCFDIPIEEIVTDFDKTTLVDVNTEHTERALSDLPPNLLCKVSLLQADMTGNVARLSTTMDSLSRWGTFEVFVESATSAVKELSQQPAHVDLGGDYSFVCSQLVLTQLSSIPFLHFSDLVGERFGRPLSMRAGLPDEPLIYALNDYNVGIQKAHVARLAELAKTKGTVHFADTFAEVKNRQVLPMVKRDTFEKIDERFTNLAEPQTWTWKPTPPREFYVAAYSLAPKPNF